MLEKQTAEHAVNDTGQVTSVSWWTGRGRPAVRACPSTWRGRCSSSSWWRSTTAIAWA